MERNSSVHNDGAKVIHLNLPLTEDTIHQDTKEAQLSDIYEHDKILETEECGDIMDQSAQLRRLKDQEEFNQSTDQFTFVDIGAPGAVGVVSTNTLGEVALVKKEELGRSNDEQSESQTSESAILQDNKTSRGQKFRDETNDEPEEKLKCGQCLFETLHRSHLKWHTYAIHTIGSMKFKCEKCPFESARRAQLKNHIETVHEKNGDQIRGNCGYASSWKAALKQHKESAHTTGNRKLKYETRSYSTVESTELMCHNNEVHENIKETLAKKNKLRLPNDQSEPQKSEPSLKLHKESIHTIKGKKLKCDKCPYSSSNRSHLKYHIKGVHENIRDHVCQECGFAARQKADLKRHNDSVHTEGDKRFKCMRCPYSSAENSKLKYHIKAVHEKMRDHACGKCEYAASEKRDLKKHIEAVHEKIRNHICGECGFATSWKTDLKRHKEAVHTTGDKKFKCENCSYSTAERVRLRYHMEDKHEKNTKY